MARLILTSKSSPGDTLRFIRKNRGLSIVDVSKETGIDTGYISRVETNKRPPIINREKVESLARVLDIDVNLLRRVFLCGQLGPIGKQLVGEVNKALGLETDSEDISVVLTGQNIKISIGEVTITVAAPPGRKIVVKKEKTKQ